MKHCSFFHQDEAIFIPLPSHQKDRKLKMAKPMSGLSGVSFINYNFLTSTRRRTKSFKKGSLCTSERVFSNRSAIYFFFFFLN